MLLIVRIRFDTDMILSSYCHRSFNIGKETFHLASLDPDRASTDIFSDGAIGT